MSCSWEAPSSWSWLEQCYSWPTTALEHICWCAVAYPVLVCLCCFPLSLSMIVLIPQGTAGIDDTRLLCSPYPRCPLSVLTHCICQSHLL